MGKAKIKRNGKTRNRSKSGSGNIYDNLVKNFLGRTFVFADFLLHYADPDFVAEIDLDKIFPAPTHYIGPKGNERIVDLVFQCPLKNSGISILTVIIFEHQNGSLRNIPRKLLKYTSAIWDAEEKAGLPLSIPYFIVLRTAKKPLRGPLPKMSDRFPKGRGGKRIGKTIEIEYDVVDLPAWDFEKLIGSAELRLLLGILKKMIEADTDGTFDSWPEALLPLLEVKDEEQKVEITKDLLDFVAKALQMHNQRLDAAAVNEALKPVFKEKADNMIKTIFDEKFLEGKIEGLAEGETKGKLEGLAEGEAKEKIESRIETIFLFLSDRFDGVTKRLEKRIQKIADVKKLNDLIKLAAKCENLKEFEKALD